MKPFLLHEYHRIRPCPRIESQALRALSPSPCSRPTDSSRTTTPERTHATRANCTLAPPASERGDSAGHFHTAVALYLEVISTPAGLHVHAHTYQEESSSPSCDRPPAKLAIRSGACTCTTSSKRLAALADLPQATVRDIVLGGGVGATSESIREVGPRPRYCLPCDYGTFRWTCALMW
jgi:hypothetical protein